MEDLATFFSTLQGVWGYIFLLVCAFLENIFPPMPGDTFVVLGAFLVGRGQLHFLPAYLAATSGSVTGFMMLFFIGKKWGRKLFIGRNGKIFSEKHLVQVEKMIDQYGYWVIGFNRFLSGFRSVVSFGAGIGRMQSVYVFLLALLSCFLWNGLIMGMGILVGENWTLILRHYQWAVFIILLLLVLIFWGRRWMKEYLLRQ